jgi:hypothetical protein
LGNINVMWVLMNKYGNIKFHGITRRPNMHKYDASNFLFWPRDIFSYFSLVPNVLLSSSHWITRTSKVSHVPKFACKTFKIGLHFVFMWLNSHLCILVGWAIMDIPQFFLFSIWGSKRLFYWKMANVPSHY